MVTLIELFDEHRQQWFTQMQDNGQPEVVSQRTVLLLDTLQLRYLEQNDLEPLRRRLVPFVMDTLKATVTILTAANQTEVWRRQPKASAHRSLSLLKKWGWRGGQLLLTFLLIITLWHQGSVLALFVVLGIIVVELSRVMPYTLTFLSQDAPIQSQVIVDKQRLHTQLADALLTADKILAELSSFTKPQTQSSLETDSALMELLQDLLAAKMTEDSLFALKKTKSIPMILAQHDIQTEAFNGNNAHLFEFLPSLDPTASDYRTLTPALVKAQRLICRGQVTQPHDPI